MLLSAAQSSAWETPSQTRTSSCISTSPTSASTLDSQARLRLPSVEHATRGYRAETQMQLPSITRLASLPSKSDPTALHEGRVGKNALKPFRCTIEGCNATFGQKGSLTRHVKSRHEKLRPHTCDLCQKSFSALWTLRVHQRNVHLKSKPHKCHICDKSFGELFNKSKHIAIVHEGKRPFSCPICSRAFGYKGDMRKHVMELHEQTGRPFQCMVPTCGVKFARKRYLRRHENLSHKGDPLLARRDASSSPESTTVPMPHPVHHARSSSRQSRQGHRLRVWEVLTL